jgi:predicted transposase/invertase (TIGR01784 family)
MAKINNPHDRGYKTLLASEEIFLELLQSFVDMGWVSQIDPDVLTKMDTTYILQDFSEKEADLVYRLKLHDQEVIFYVLLELQSTVDFQMPYRLLVYMMGIWKDVLKNIDHKEAERKDFKLPSIVPIVLYNSKERWTACRSFKDTLAVSELFGEHVVDFKYILIDVNRYEKQTLTALDNFIGSVFKIDQAVGPKEYRNRLLEIGPTLKKFDSQKFYLFVSWLKMVTNASQLPEEAKRELVNILDESKPEEAEKMVTNMEQTLGRMYEEGILEGIMAGKMKDARKMLTMDMSEDLIAKITELPLEEIKKLKAEITGETH